MTNTDTIITNIGGGSRSNRASTPLEAAAALPAITMAAADASPRRRAGRARENRSTNAAATTTARPPIP